MFKQLQEEHKLWALKNFGEQDVEDYCLGMIEEVGELAHAVLKRKQDIRNNEDHDANIKDAIGDIIIYLVGYCNCVNIDLSVVYQKRNITNHNNLGILKIVTFISMSISLLASGQASDIEHRKSVISILFERLFYFCYLEGFDFEDTVINTWNEVVSKRDWKKNPDCVSVEEARKTIEDSGFKVAYHGCPSEWIVKNEEFELPTGFGILKATKFEKTTGFRCRCVEKPLSNHKVINVIDSKIHLCDNCKNEFPICKCGEVVFGNSKGNDNIIECEGFKAVNECITDDIRFHGFPV